MRRGTTPTHTYTLPFDVSMVADVRIIYKQDGVVKIRKGLDDCILEDDTIALKLTRAEMMSLGSEGYVNIQVEIWTPTGDVLVSDIHRKAVGECLDDEV